MGHQGSSFAQGKLVGQHLIACPAPHFFFKIMAYRPSQLAMEHCWRLVQQGRIVHAARFGLQFACVRSGMSAKGAASFINGKQRKLAIQRFWRFGVGSTIPLLMGCEDGKNAGNKESWSLTSGQAAGTLGWAVGATIGKLRPIPYAAVGSVLGIGIGSLAYGNGLTFGNFFVRHCPAAAEAVVFNC